MGIAKAALRFVSGADAVLAVAALLIDADNASIKGFARKSEKLLTDQCLHEYREVSDADRDSVAEIATGMLRRAAVTPTRSRRQELQVAAVEGPQALGGFSWIARRTVSGLS